MPCPSPFADWIEQLAAEAITGGCGGGNYCPPNPNTRGQMAVFLTKTFEPAVACCKHTRLKTRPLAALWLLLAAASVRGRTSEIVGRNPPRNWGQPAGRMVVFAIFSDVPCPSQFADWIEQFAAEKTTVGCGGGNYSPDDPTTRGQIAVFLTKALGL